MGALYGEIYVDWSTPIEPSVLASTIAKLKHRGRAGQTLRRAPGAALAWANAGTPNDIMLDGQPWLDRDLWIAFDGALHNRAALTLELKLPAGTRVMALLVHAWRRFGAALAQRLEGNFVLVLVDFAQRKVILARDPLGARALHYQMLPANAHAPACLRFASEVDALTGPNAQPSSQAVANYFAFVAAPVTQTMFADVKTLAAGAQLTLHHASLSVETRAFECPEPIRKIADADAIRQFRALLEASVHVHLPAIGRLGVSLSGGLDSNALFALSANSLPAQSLCALSWRFEQLKVCDESAFSSAHAASRKIEHLQFGADAWTVLCAPALRPISLNTPHSNIYRELKTQLYARAAMAKVHTVFNGAFGDHLFIDTNEWLSDALARWDLSPIIGEYLWRVRLDPRFWRDAAIRRVLRRLLGLGVYRYSHMTEMTPFARTQIELSDAVGILQGIRAHHIGLNLGASAQFGASGETEFAERFGIDLATPFRSPALLRFMLSLPVHLSQRRGESKWILREAMRGTMPEAIRARPKSSSLQPFFDAAIAGPARAQTLALLFSADADWPRFYQSAIVKGLFESKQRSDADSAKLWRCMGYELWRIARGLRRFEKTPF